MKRNELLIIIFIVLFFSISLALIFSVEELREGFKRALWLIASGDPEIIGITTLSIYISGTATVLSLLWCIPIGVTLGLRDFAGRRFITAVFNALIGIPTVALGLVLYLFFSSSGPLGSFDLLLNPIGVSLGQAILITPILISLVANAVEAVDPSLKDLAETLGASEAEASLAILKESTSGVVLAIVAGFNRAIAELGVVQMIGQNLRWRTRVLTTAIAMERTSANFALSIALAIILLIIVLSISLTVNLLQRRLK